MSWAVHRCGGRLGWSSSRPLPAHGGQELNRLEVFVVAGPGLAGRVGADSPMPVVTLESADPFGVSFPGSVQPESVKVDEATGSQAAGW